MSKNRKNASQDVVVDDADVARVGMRSSLKSAPGGGKYSDNPHRSGMNVLKGALGSTLAGLALTGMALSINILFRYSPP